MASESQRSTPRRGAVDGGDARWSTLYARVGPGGAQRRLWLAAVALVAALPSLAWAASGSAFVHDDWDLAFAYGHGGPGELVRALWDGATVAPARPAAALYYAVTYGLLSTHPVLHTLVQAAVNAAAGVLVFLAAERVWRTEVAVWAGAVYAALPNRGSTQLWAAVAPNALAVALVAGAVLLLSRSRWGWATAALVLAALSYEGVLAVALLVVAWWVLPERHDRWRRGAVMAALVGAAGAFLFLRSPKRSGTVTDTLGLDRLISSQIGSAVFTWPWLATIGSALVVLGVLVVLVLPGPRQARYRSPMIGALVLWAASLAPFVAVRWPVGGEGFFDRANVVIGLGTAAVIGTLLAWLVDLSPGPVGAVVGIALVGLFAATALSDVVRYRAAGDEGEQLLAQVLEDVPPTDRTVRVIPPPSAEGGVSQFPGGANLTAAVAFARGDHTAFWVLPEVERLPVPDDALCYDRIRRLVTECEP